MEYLSNMTKLEVNSCYIFLTMIAVFFDYSILHRFDGTVSNPLPYVKFRKFRTSYFYLRTTTMREKIALEFQ